MEKKYWNKGAFMTGLNTMIVADEQRLDEIADPVIREAVRKQLEVKLPVHPDKVLIKMECVGVCGSDVHYFHEGQCGTFFLDPGRDIPYMLVEVQDAYQLRSAYKNHQWFEKKMQALGPYRYKILPLEDTIHFCNSNHLFIPGIEMFNQDFVVDLKQALDQTEAR